MQYLLVAHIFAGCISLIAAVFAVVSSKGKQAHILAGRTYFWGMAVIFLTAIPMSISSSNVFLFLIAIFSFYLAYAGMRFARNRTGTANLFDWVAVGLMVFSGLAMWFLALVYFMNNNSQYITLTVFGFIAISLGYMDFRSYRNKSAIGKQRIARHLTNMLAGTIAVITAVLVTNLSIEPVFILWILPTIIISPLIFWWNRKILGLNKVNKF
jgi:hypothetical protein|tara:strand:+ start:230 stop:865 length:636 start_codon:yes stop_codon:yes gene_type:complete